MKRAILKSASTVARYVLIGMFCRGLLISSVGFADENSQENKSDIAATQPKQPPKRDLPVTKTADQQSSKIEALADSLEYQKETKKLIARGNAVITYQDTKLVADYAEVETDAKKAFAKGHVMVYEGTSPRLQGNELYYDFGNHAGNFPDARAISLPWYAKAKEVQGVKKDVYKIRNGSMTTCYLDKPHYEIRAKKATMYSEEKIIMYNVTIYVLGKPVFWLPIMDVPLNWPNIPIQGKTGYSQRYGAYIELVKGVTINKNLWGKAHADWRSKRGFGGGWDQYYEFEQYAKGSVKLYWTQDKEAPSPGHTDSVSGESDPYAETEERDRGRITWNHRTDIADNTNLLLRYHRADDEYVLQDFFEGEYRSDIQPTSFLTVNHNTERYGAMAHFEKKMNSYESMVERLPEIRLDWKNQPFFKDLIFNESRIQFDNLAKRFDRSDYNEDVVRTDAYSRFYMPLRWKGISLTPFAGYRGTEYSRQLTTSKSVYRSAMDYGVDTRTHFYKTHDVSFHKAGIEINQLRHIIEPSVRFEGTSSTLSDDHIAHFDTTDRIDDSSQVIFGLDNRLQTKRVLCGKTQRVDIVSFNTYLRFETSPVDSNIHGAQFTDWNNELVLRPYEWLQYEARSTYDFSQTYLKLFNHDIVVRRGKWRFLFGQRYVHDHVDWYSGQQIEKSHQFVFDTQYKLNHLWSLGGYIRWDSATSSLGEWQLSAIRDLHDFVLDFGYNVRNSLIDPRNNTLYFSFRIKGLPMYTLNSGGSRATFSEPRIGDTVAGSHQQMERIDPLSAMSASWFSPRPYQE